LPAGVPSNRLAGHGLRPGGRKDEGGRVLMSEHELALGMTRQVIESTEKN
jgi:hypothetical protein